MRFLMHFTMRVMVIVKASAHSETDEMPPGEAIGQVRGLPDQLNTAMH